ncbi:ATP-grasp fold amidoligase family protein [Sinanaerobacter chloroacetimidivorans]|uniref:Uncharacterized protein n=1 Tax=Sinanaerobacter chloroacetimidivorans TaxID=2818044 RepID=A0A8J7W5Y7_9FIRM|nr:ATP-grasp fold amidoligase family protein [Sinanaerobacter chloroacetimidivorans]MBR0599525.1 hypothetical protein [Sinanaerobacter chloroacetimidivorans]
MRKIDIDILNIKIAFEKIIYILLPERIFRSLRYFVCYRHWFKFNDPKLYSEKIWWLKYYNKKCNKELLQKCYDKHNVRDFYKQVLGPLAEKYLTQEYAVFNNANEIDIEKLPDRFILKVTQANGFNIICKDKKKLDMDKARTTLNKWLDQSKRSGRFLDEGYLFDGKPLIQCEELLEDEDGKIPNDYRVLCFNGDPQYICVDIDSIDQNGEKSDFYFRNFYDTDWNFIPLSYGRPFKEDVIIEKPQNLLEMLNVAKKVSKDFIFVRVDLYNFNGRIVCGELTWTPQGGTGKLEPISYDRILGQKLTIPSNMRI